MNPKISVVIPVYNVEKYLKTCVESVLRQTFQDFEIILVDDGSKDKSGEICDSLSKNAKISVIHKKNKGPSHTRNTGTMAAKGEYITYIDSDDTVERHYLQIMLSLIEKYEADMSSCEFCFCKENEKIIMRDEYSNGILSGREALKKMLIGRIHGTSACGLLIKSELAKKHEFPVGKFHEDDLTSYKYFMSAEKVAYTKAPLYVYYQRDGSIMHRDFGIADIHELDAGDIIYNDCKKLGDEYAKAAIKKKTDNYLQVLLKYNELDKIDSMTYSRIYEFFKSNFLTLMMNGNVSKRNKIKIILLMIGMLNMVRGI